MPVLGLHILGDRGLSVDAIADEVRQLNARYHVVMNNSGLAARLLPLNTSIIYRHWPDDNLHETAEPRAHVRMVDKIAPKGCLLYLGNEPARSTLSTLNTWTIAALDECERLGRRGVILNFSTGSPEPNDWETLRGCVERAHAGDHLLGLHQYFDRQVTLSFPWHVGRERDARAAFGGKTPRIVITELGCAVGYDPYKGWRTALTDDAYTAELTLAADHYFAQEIHACLFALCSADDRQWGTFVPSARVLAGMARANSAAGRSPAPPGSRVQKPARAGDPEVGELQTGTFIRLRGAPTLQGTELARMRQGQRLRWYPATERRADNFDWVYVETDMNDGALAGWIARVWAAWTTQFQPVPPEPEPLPGVPDMLAEARQLQEALRQLEQNASRLLDEARELGARLDPLLRKLEQVVG